MTASTFPWPHRSGPGTTAGAYPVAFPGEGSGPEERWCVRKLRVLELPALPILCGHLPVPEEWCPPLGPPAPGQHGGPRLVVRWASGWHWRACFFRVAGGLPAGRGLVRTGLAGPWAGVVDRLRGCVGPRSDRRASLIRAGGRPARRGLGHAIASLNVGVMGLRRPTGSARRAALGEGAGSLLAPLRVCIVGWPGCGRARADGPSLALVPMAWGVRRSFGLVFPTLSGTVGPETGRVGDGWSLGAACALAALARLSCAAGIARDPEMVGKAHRSLQRSRVPAHHPHQDGKLSSR